MIFMPFAVGIAAVFFVSSLAVLRLGRYFGLRHRKRSGTEGLGGLATIEGAIFGLMGLLLAFTISGALQVRRPSAIGCSGSNGGHHDV
jgi:hypothetical protein